MSKYIIVVDDERDLGKPVEHSDGVWVDMCRTSIEGVAAMKAAMGTGTFIDELWLDYTLSMGDHIEPVIEWMKQNHPEIGTVHVHTASPTGRALIRELLEGHYEVVGKTDLF